MARSFGRSTGERLNFLGLKQRADRGIRQAPGRAWSLENCGAARPLLPVERKTTSRRRRSCWLPTSTSLGTCTNYQFRKFQTARSLLHQSRFLRPNTHFSAFFEIYKICKPLHRSKFKICRFFAFFSWFFKIFSKFCWNFQKSVIFVEIFTDFCRNCGKW